jgi:hypothetical protein
LPAFYAALGVLPVLAVSLLMGGVTSVQFWKTSLAILNLFFFFHAAAMLASAWCRDPRSSAGLLGLILISYGIGLRILSQLAHAYNHPGMSMFLQTFLPIHAVYMAFLPGLLPPSSASFGSSLAAVHLNGWLFLALASFALPHRWQDKPREPKRLRIWFEQWRFGTAAARTAFRRRLLAINPFFWLASRRQSGPAAIWAAFGLAGAAFAGVCIWAVRTGNEWQDIYVPLSLITLVVFHLALKLGIASAAAGTLEAQRRDGGLETILSCTPMSVSEILAGQRLVLRRLFLWPAVTVIALSLVMVALAWKLGGREEENLEISYVILTATAMLAPDMIALAWMATWLGMLLPKAKGGAGKAFLLVCVAPWLVIFAIISPLLPLGVVKEPILPWALWLFIGLGMDVAICKVARRQLQKNFRRWAVSSFDPAVGSWRRLGRFLGI